MKQNLFIFSAFILLPIMGIVSCKKKKGDNQGLDDRNKQPFDIMPVTSGSWWLYQAEDGAVFYRYATGKDSFVAGLTYEYFYRIDTTSEDRVPIPEYFGKNKDKYLSLIDLDGAEKNYITYVILKDNWYTRMIWSNTETQKIEGLKVDMFIESEILNVNETLKINGKTYDSVIHVYNHLQAKLAVSPLYTNTGTLEVWFKKGVGVIKEKGNIKIAPAGVTLVEKHYADELIDYHFVP